MTTRLRLISLTLSAACASAAWASLVHAQPPGDLPTPPAGPDGPAPEAPAAPPPSAPDATEPPAPGTPPPADAAPPAPPPETPPTVFPPVEKPKKDVPQGEEEASLPITVGAVPTVTDFGGEADLVTTVNRPHARAFTRKWTYSLGGYLRAPMNVGYGPRNDQTDGNELHAPPRVPGASLLEWNTAGLVPPPQAALFVTIENARVAANIILQTDTYWDAGYDNLDEVGGIAQAYVTLKFNDAFGDTGGFNWTVGAFSNRYGMAGPRQQSAGYYQTYLFGRTHTTGETLTGTFHLSDDLDLVLEHGFGAKLEVVPFTPRTHEPPPPIAPWLPDQGPAPLGSNFLHHAHAALVSDGGLNLAAHYLESWTPNDFSIIRGERAPSSRMRILGGEVHLDDVIPGNAYVGYSFIKAKRLFPLSDAVEVLHSRGGVNFKENFFGLVDPRFYSGEVIGRAPENDSGDVQSVLFQYMLRLSQLSSGAAAPAASPEAAPAGATTIATTNASAPDAGIALFGMFNHVEGDFAPCAPRPEYPPVYCGDFKQDRFKFGAELSVTPFNSFSFGARFDRVMPDGSDAETAYSAFSPRVMIHTRYISREYIMFGYTRYFMGDAVVARNTSVPPGAVPNNTAPALENFYFTDPDPNLFVIAAAVSF